MVEMLQILYMVDLLQMLHMVTMRQMLHMVGTSWWQKLELATEPCRQELLRHPVAVFDAELTRVAYRTVPVSYTHLTLPTTPYV